MRLWGILLAAAFALGLVVGRPRAATGYDLSGVGTCDGTQIHVQHASLWAQYPATPSVAKVNTVPPGFQGKNAIVWSDAGVIQDFVIAEVDGMTVTAATTLHVQGTTCHFTLDPDDAGWQDREFSYRYTYEESMAPPSAPP